jgi:hypothetical protein
MMVYWPLLFCEWLTKYWFVGPWYSGMVGYMFACSPCIQGMAGKMMVWCPLKSGNGWLHDGLMGRGVQGTVGYMIIWWPLVFREQLVTRWFGGPWYSGYGWLHDVYIHI